MRRAALLFALFVSFYALPHSAASQAPADPVDAALAEQIEALHVTFAADDLDGVRAARAAFESVLEAGDLTARQRAAAHYYVALADYRLGSRLMEDDRGAARDYLGSARDHAGEVLDQGAGAEAFRSDAEVLRAGAYGQLSGLRPLRAMIYGPRAERALEAAFEHDAENPRAFLIDGLSLLYKPAMFGGDPAKAVERFERAAALAAEAPAPSDPLLPTWGEADAYAWLGQALATSGQLEPARRAYEQALEVEPGYDWVRDILLPALDAQ
jgi:tetratricopeptide (TPR) repeat protein